MSTDNTDISKAEKCFTNIELVANICKFLNYKQQLQLLNVSEELRYIITNFIWKRQFKEVEVLIYHTTNNILLSDKINTQANDFLIAAKECEILRRNNLLLKTNEMNNFFNINADNIKKLQILANEHYERVAINYPLEPNLTNLTSLSCARITLTNEDLQRVAENCLYLETLVFSNCLNIKGLALVLDSDIDLQIIQNMLNLRHLTINDNRLKCDEQHLHKFSNVKNISNLLKLQSLKLNITILPDASTNDEELNFDNLKYCTTFQIGHFSKTNDYFYFQTNILPKFKNLDKLCLRIYHNNISLSKDFFTILMNSSKNLTNLSIENCRVTDFIEMPKLQELLLRDCRGLTCQHLKIILNDMHLKCFTSLYTTYKGNLEFFPISASLQKLKCDFSCDYVLKLLKFNQQKLINLTDFRWNRYNFEDYALKLSNIAPRLQVLHIEQLQLNINDCYQLIFLQKVVLSSYHIVISELLLLIKHKSLRDLSIDYVSICDMDITLSELEAFHTNVLSLTIPWSIIEAMSDFWLDLLEINTKLSLTCFNITTDLICYILSNAKFPRRFSYINICGFPIDCISIRRLNLETILKIELLMDLFKYYGKRYFTLD